MGDIRITEKMGAIRRRSAKRPGRHQPANTKIKRKIVHRVNNIRGFHAPEAA